MVLFFSACSQVTHKESEEALQKRLDEVSQELCRSQSSHASLRADAEKAQEQQQQLAGEGRGSAGRLGRARVLSESRIHGQWAEGTATSSLVCCGGARARLCLLLAFPAGLWTFLALLLPSSQVWKMGMWSLCAHRSPSQSGDDDEA